jgi:putative DNA primase/helicase
VGGQRERFAASAPSPGGDLVTEDAAALRFVERHRCDLRFCHHAGRWFQWTGSHWQPEETALAFSWARRVARELGRASGSGRAAVQAAKASFAAGVERFCQSDRAFAVTNADWDRDPWLLATPGGTVDLRTGELRPARREDRITRCSAVAPMAAAECSTWLAFLQEATDGDGEFVRFLQRWFGYCLTGTTREHALLFLYGPGGNGKGVLLNTVRGVMGTYAAVAAMDAFTASAGDKHSTDLAMLRGARLVMATETEEGRAWAEARIKALTAGDPVTARFMRQDNFTFDPAFKLTISGNHKPALRNVDDAARRRFMIAPLVHRPAIVDRSLADKLRAEWPAILRWMVEGCLAWQSDGLQPPQAVLAATADYFEEQDHFGRWLAERGILDPQLNSRPSHLLADFQGWCARNGEPKPDARRLRPLLDRTERLRYVTRRGTQLVQGIGLRPPEADQHSDGVEGGGR